jgi:hypothetical protein
VSEQLSRPLAVAAALLPGPSDLARVGHLFAGRRVLVRLEPALAGGADARQTVVLAVNEILRFCPNIALALPPEDADLVEIANTLAAEIHGPAHPVTTASMEETAYDAVLNVGVEVRGVPGWVTVSSDSWLARVATAVAGAMVLPRPEAPPNPLGALGAACLGAGQVFLALIGRSLLATPMELSLHSLESGPLGTLAPGPMLAEELPIEALLVGCGGVANGWAYAIKRLPITGAIEAVDHQALRPENLGPYVCAGRSSLTRPKAQIIHDQLAPAIDVTPRTERLRFFKARLRHGQTAVPDLVISALDNPHTRHDVQRLWSPTTIDLAAEELTAQVIVKNLRDDGICLLEAYTVPDGEPDELARLAAATGLAPERVADFESQITEEDIAAAPADKRAALEDARRRGQPICGRVGDLDLGEEQDSPGFTPAVPFVTAFTGIVAAAQTMRLLLGEPPSSLHFQCSFLSYRSRRMGLKCAPACECRIRQEEAGQPGAAG